MKLHQADNCPCNIVLYMLCNRIVFLRDMNSFSFLGFHCRAVFFRVYMLHPDSILLLNLRRTVLLWSRKMYNGLYGALV